MIDKGAVSIETVSEMLDGVIKKFDATFAIAVSGVAGPGGGTAEKPVGTVVVGVQNNCDWKDIQMYHLSGNREEVQAQAMRLSLDLIYKKIKNM
jgi:nicotinamide-nucleotide amidase